MPVDPPGDYLSRPFEELSGMLEVQVSPAPWFYCDGGVTDGPGSRNAETRSIT